MQLVSSFCSQHLQKKTKFVNAMRSIYIYVNIEYTYLPRTKSFSNLYPGFNTDSIMEASPKIDKISQMIKSMILLKIQRPSWRTQNLTMVICQMFRRNHALDVPFNININYYCMRSYSFNTTWYNTPKFHCIIFRYPVNKQYSNVDMFMASYIVKSRICRKYRKQTFQV